LALDQQKTILARDNYASSSKKDCSHISVVGRSVMRDGTEPSWSHARRRLGIRRRMWVVRCAASCSRVASVGTARNKTGDGKIFVADIRTLRDFDAQQASRHLPRRRPLQLLGHALLEMCRILLQLDYLGLALTTPHAFFIEQHALVCREDALDFALKAKRVDASSRRAPLLPVHDALNVAERDATCCDADGVIELRVGHKERQLPNKEPNETVLIHQRPVALTVHNNASAYRESVEINNLLESLAVYRGPIELRCDVGELFVRRGGRRNGRDAAVSAVGETGNKLPRRLRVVRVKVETAARRHTSGIGHDESD